MRPGNVQGMCLLMFAQASCTLRSILRWWGEAWDCAGHVFAHVCTSIAEVEEHFEVVG